MQNLSCLFLLPILVILFVTGQNAVADELSDQDLNEIHALSNNIQTLCPPAECVVVGIGRSPAPVVAKLQSNSQDYAWNLPLTSFKYGVSHREDLSPEHQSALNEHFEKFLPSQAVLNNRRVMLLDYSQTGDSLLSAKSHVEQYLKKRGDNASAVSTIAMVESHVKPRSSIDYALSLPNPNGKNFIDKLDSLSFKHYSQYGKFDLASGQRPTADENPEYRSLVDKFRKRNEVRDQKIALPEVRQTHQKMFDGNWKDLHPDERLRLMQEEVSWYPPEKQKIYFHQALEDPDPRVAREAAFRIDSYKPADRLSLYHKAAQHPDETVRGHFKTRLETFHPSPTETHEFSGLLEHTMSHEDEELRRKAREKVLSTYKTSDPQYHPLITKSLSTLKTKGEKKGYYSQLNNHITEHYKNDKQSALKLLGTVHSHDPAFARKTFSDLLDEDVDSDDEFHRKLSAHLKPASSSSSSASPRLSPKSGPHSPRSSTNHSLSPRRPQAPISHIH